MKKAAKILAVISVASACSLSIGLWQKLTEKQDRTSGRGFSENEQVHVPEVPAGWPVTKEVVRVVAAPAVREPEPEDSPSGAASEAPASAQSRRAAIRSFLESSHPDLAEEVGLTQEEAAAMLDLVLEGNLQAFEASAARERSAVERRSAILEAQLRQDSALTALIGEQRFKQWEVYRHGAQRRHQVALLREALAGQAPLSDEQARALVAVVSSENVRLNGMQNSAESRPTPDVRDIEESHRRLIDAASAILSSTQLAAYEERLGAEMAARRQQQLFLQTQPLR